MAVFLPKNAVSGKNDLILSASAGTSLRGYLNRYNLTIYYELSKEHIAIINRKCHDLKHQLKALAADDSQRAEYIKETQESIEFYFGLDTSI